MEFDKSKILTVVTADQAIACKKGWFSNDIPSLKIYIERGDDPKGLQDVDVHNEYPFRESYPSDGSFACKYRYFYPASEPTYEERQDMWIKQNGVKAGTRVRFIKNFNADIDGSHCCEHLDAMGKTGVITGSNLTSSVEVLVEGVSYHSWSVPYTALEVIKEPTYRPFANAEEFKPYRDKWCIDNLKGRFKVDWHSDTHIYEYGNSFITWEEAFEKYKFEDGTPFGVKEEV